jgi:hypothetical protein
MASASPSSAERVDLPSRNVARAQTSTAAVSNRMLDASVPSNFHRVKMMLQYIDEFSLYIDSKQLVFLIAVQQGQISTLKHSPLAIACIARSGHL